MCEYTWLYECFDGCNFSCRVYTFICFIHKVRLCRRAPESGLNVRLDVPGRDRRIPTQDKKNPPQDRPPLPSSHPTFPSQPLNTDLGFGWQDQGGQIGIGTLAIHWDVPWHLSEFQGRIQEKLGNTEVSWGPAGNRLKTTEDNTDPFSGGHTALVHSCLWEHGSFKHIGAAGSGVSPAPCVCGQLAPYPCGQQNLDGWEKFWEKRSG